ncbi:hypothetical protein Lal_00045226 [Lupinus albus]|nr:hypothetical protein Lal_00045226 [Lupinus albus]
MQDSLNFHEVVQPIEREIRPSFNALVPTNLGIRKEQRFLAGATPKERDLKSSNILQDNEYNAKLSDYGLAKLAGKDKMNIVPTRFMGTYG